MEASCPLTSNLRRTAIVLQHESILDKKDWFIQDTVLLRTKPLLAYNYTCRPRCPRTHYPPALTFDLVRLQTSTISPSTSWEFWSWIFVWAPRRKGDWEPSLMTHLCKKLQEEKIHDGWEKDKGPGSPWWLVPGMDLILSCLLNFQRLPQMDPRCYRF